MKVLLNFAGFKHFIRALLNAVGVGVLLSQFHIDFFEISIISIILMISNNNKVSYVTLIVFHAKKYKISLN